jgi:hypothetical protein
MENSEIQQESILEKNELKLDSISLDFLAKIRKWTMFFSILGFIFIGLIALAGIFMLFAGSLFGSILGGVGGFVIFILYLAIGALYFFPIYYLFKFSENMKNALEKSEQITLTKAFDNLHSHYKFIGILTIVIISLYILIGIFAGIAGVASMF